MRAFRPLLAAHDLTEQQWRVLRALASRDQPLGVGELADSTFLLGPSLTRILANLGRRELLNRSVAADDQRRGIVTLTPAGQELVNAIAPHSEARYTAIEDGFGPDNLTQLMTLLAQLENLDELNHEQEAP